MHGRIVVGLVLAITGASLGQTTVDPSTVSESDRDYWCQSQETQCPLICLQLPGVHGDPTSNTCDPDTLQFSCVCSNGNQPNASHYSQTIPYFICQEWGNKCVEDCGGNNICADKCRADHPCGAQDPKRVDTSTMTPTSSSSLPTIPTTGLGGTGTPLSTGNPAAALTPMTIGYQQSLAVVFFGVFAGFALML